MKPLDYENPQTDEHLESGDEPSWPSTRGEVGCLLGLILIGLIGVTYVVLVAWAFNGK